jgi:oligopeptide transport system ATP-binding protein
MDRVMSARPQVDAESPAEAETLVELRDVSVRYDLPRTLPFTNPGTLLAVDRVNLSLVRGQTLGIVGATGSGKSTIAKLIMGMQAPTEGSVFIGRNELAKISGRERLALQRLRQVVLQDPYSSLDPRMKVGNIIAEPMLHGPRDGRLNRQQVRDRVAELLKLVGLPPGKADLYPHQFSGGQRQRISIARALAPEPEIIVLDEPTSALDVSVRAQILNLLKDLQDRLGVSYLIISHDLVTVAFLASVVAVMYRGRVVEIGPTRSIYATPRHPYTIELLASTPSASGAFLAMPVKADDSPAALSPMACRYASQCTLREKLGRPARCTDEDPALAPVGPGHMAACHFSGEAAALADKLGVDADG